jgi:hypothetical protein
VAARPATDGRLGGARVVRVRRRGACALVLGVVVLGLVAVGGATAQPTVGQSAQSGQYAGGNGTTDDPYRIATWAHLNNTRDQPGANFTLVNNLNETTPGYDAVASSGANGGTGFVPIGGLRAPERFTGTFDGAGHTIDGLTLNRSGENRVGLFGYVWNGGTVTNLTLTDATVAGATRTGGLAGVVKGGTITRSSVHGSVRGKSSVGGLAGVVFNIPESTTQEPVRSLVAESSVRGSVTGRDGRAGGLVGLNQGTLRDSYARAQVTGNPDNPTGGLVGVHGNEGSLRDSYAAGAVVGGQTGGLTGQTSGTFAGVYWDLNATGQENATALGTAGGAVGLPRSALTGTAARTNTTLGFESTWVAVGCDYPALSERPTACPPVLVDAQPRDPDSDGQYEDVDGTGGFTILDVQALFNNLDTPALQESAAQFTFSGISAEVTVLDVQELFNELAAS